MTETQRHQQNPVQNYSVIQIMLKFHTVSNVWTNIAELRVLPKIYNFFLKSDLKRRFEFLTNDLWMVSVYSASF